MDSDWTELGLSSDSDRTELGLSSDSDWTLIGLSSDSDRTLIGLSSDSDRTKLGLLRIRLESDESDQIPIGLVGECKVLKNSWIEYIQCSMHYFHARYDRPIQSAAVVQLEI